MGLRKTVLQVTVLHDDAIDAQAMDLPGILEGAAVREFLVTQELQYSRDLEPAEVSGVCIENGDVDGTFAKRFL